MTYDQQIELMRTLLGQLEVNDVANRVLDIFLITGLEWLAGELEYLVIEDDNLLSLTAGQREYPLPPDLASIIWVTWNNIKLNPSTTYLWDRDGTTFRTIVASNPSEFAVQARTLILSPPASAAAVTTAGTLGLRYIAFPTKIGAGGPNQLSELDQRIATYYAAMAYCWSNPSEENMAREQGFEKMIATMLPAAKRRDQFPIEDQAAFFRPYTNRRQAAR